MIPKPLDGIFVVEMGTTEAEGMASLLLSDFGAEVVRLEFPKNGEEAPKNDEEASGLPEKDAPDRTSAEEASLYRLCDRGKKRVLCDPGLTEDRKWIRKLLQRADAVITSVPDVEMAQWNLNIDTLCSKNPGLVYASVTGFGQTGPYAHHYVYNDAVIQAESGFMSVTGEEGGEAVRSGSDFAAFAGAAHACIAVLMALIEAKKTGRGRRIDVSMMDCLLYGFENQYSIYLKSGKIPKPMGNRYALSAPVGDFLCRDGKRLMISVATEMQWKNFAEVLGHTEWLENPDYRNVKERLRHVKPLCEEVSAALMEHDSEELMELLQTRSCIYGRINDFADVVRHPQVKARQMIMEVEAPDGTKFKMPSHPIVMDGCKPAKTVIERPALYWEWE